MFRLAKAAARLVFKRMKDGSIVESELFLLPLPVTSCHFQTTYCIFHRPPWLLNCLKDEREVRLRYLLWERTKQTYSVLPLGELDGRAVHSAAF